MTCIKFLKKIVEIIGYKILLTVIFTIYLIFTKFFV